MENSNKFKYNRLFIIGFGFFGVSIIWPLYNSYVPIFLKETFNIDSVFIGSIMSIDNVLAVFLLPFLGALSDKTNTRIGKRRPFILIGSPFALAFFCFIPYTNFTQNLILFMVNIILLNLSMALFRSPVIALMPDITPSKFRSLGNGIINFMGGIGSLLAFIGGKFLYDKNINYPFFAGGTLMFLGSLLVVILVNEDKKDEEREKMLNFSLKKSFEELFENLSDVIKQEKSLLFVLISIFFWFIGFNSIETFFTSFAKYYLGFKESTGAMIMGFYSISFIIFAILSGFIGQLLGRKKTIIIGLILFTVILIISVYMKSFIGFVVIFIFAGFFWSLINVNSLPMIVDMTKNEKVGGYTGLYYLFSQSANIIAPPIMGFFIDIFTHKGENPSGYVSLMIGSSISFAIAAVIMFFVKRGESVKI